MDLSPLRVVGFVHVMSMRPGWSPGVALRLVTGFKTEGVWLLDTMLLYTSVPLSSATALIWKSWLWFGRLAMSTNVAVAPPVTVAHEPAPEVG